jgi:RNA polymerase sigma-70 factor (ECF subfamily)
MNNVSTQRNPGGTCSGTGQGIGDDDSQAGFQRLGDHHLMGERNGLSESTDRVGTPGSPDHVLALAVAGGAPSVEVASPVALPARNDLLDDGVDRKLLGKAAFEQLYLRNHRRVAGFLARVLGRDGEVEDVVNDTMLMVWQRARELPGASPVSTWIFSIAYRCALKAIESRAMRRKANTLVIRGNTTMPSDTTQAVENHQILDLALASLPIDQRVVLVLAYYLDQSCEEIAAVVDCPVNTVNSRMLHARRMLGQFIADAGRVSGISPLGSGCC